MKRFFIIPLSIICILLLSSGYFLWIYNEIGFIFTVKCLFAWGFCLSAYTVCLGLLFLLIEDFDII